MKKVVGPVGSAVTTVFVYNAGGQLVAEYTNSTSPPSGGGGTSYLTSDHLSSTRVVTKADGTVKARYDYLPFGEELPTDKRPAGIGYGGSDGTKQKFTQKERDDESGLDYFLARYYSSAQGRFTSVDPLLASATAVNAQSWNRYSYTINNPLKYVDGSGMIWGLLKTNFGSRYWWYEDEEALKAAGATEVTANALGAHVYQAEGGAWIRLDLGQNRWRAYDREFEAQFGRTLIEEGSSHDGDLGLTLDLFFVAQGGVGVARLGAGAFTRIFTGAGSELTTLGLSGGANTFGRTGTTPLFRAVMQGELDDIMSTQAFRNPAELEVKYFSETANGAASYARQSSRAFGDGPFTLVETRIPTNLINNSMRSTVDGGIRTLVVQTELLPLLSRPRIWSYTPLPAK
ncbi:MAG: RHS repeat-associated core domain-containing protein [Nitrospira sp.]|nr:MAG: RHS repeat-associated core domain-containing protein [Nitrospira sp.]